jgi:hypothetical protein
VSHIIEVHVPWQRSERPCVCVLVETMLHVSTMISLLIVGTVLTVWYFSLLNMFIYLVLSKSWFNYVSKTIYHMQLKWKYCTYLKKIQNNFILIIIGKTYFIFYKRELCPIFFCAANNNCDEFIKLAINACMWGLPFYS